MGDEERVRRAWHSLEALAVGDGFGECFFSEPSRHRRWLSHRELPPGPWRVTDDTVMALSVLETLIAVGHVDPDALAKRFADRYRLEPQRGYGRMAHEILRRIGRGERWQEVSASVFDGMGSMGNGAAMRVAPLGAFFCDDYARVVQEAQTSAVVTHCHPEGQAGAVAVAMGAAWVGRGEKHAPDLFAAVLEHTPRGATWDGIFRAAQLGLDESIEAAVAAVGNGSRVLAEDTVPFTLWCVARHLGDFEAAMWTTVAGRGDRDTTCAIVAGILGADPACEIPASWLEACPEAREVGQEPEAQESLD